MATSTYVALDKVTISNSTTSSITFSSISSSYTDLVVVFSGKMSIAGEIPFARFNGSTTGYSITQMYGDGASAASFRRTSQTFMPMGWFTGFASATENNLIFNLQNYSNTTTNKTALWRLNNPSTTGTPATAAGVGLWQSTSAVTSVEFYASSGFFASGSTFSLYGIAATGAGAKATGGVVYADDQYYYHVFGSTGTFTPLQSLSADYLVVAGGGGGASGGGAAGTGGGGAGGFLTGTVSVSTAQTVTIGAGGAGGTSGSGAQGGNSVFGSVTSTGGGFGAGFPGNANSTGGTGGSGGGGSSVFSGYSSTGGSATSGQGYAGGTGTVASTYAGGGGGGAGAVGSNAATNGGNGGAGLSSSLTNAIGAATGMGQLVSSNYFFAGGGGGGTEPNAGNAASTGGSGGGGAGRFNTGLPTNGTANLGGGGGGSSGTGVAGGAGGSGVVIVRYLKA